MAQDNPLDAELPSHLTELLHRLRGNHHTGGTVISSRQWVVEYMSSSDHDRFWSVKNFRGRILQALGACKTLRSIDTVDFWSYLNLSASDWETFLTPLKGSTTLEEVTFHYPEEHEEYDDAKLSMLGRLWADVLTSVESVRSVRFATDLSRKFVAELIQGLSDRTFSSLTQFIVEFIPDSPTALHIASIIRRSPQLRYLILGGVCSLREDAAEAWSQALMGAESLEGVTIEAVQGGVGVSKVLAKGFSASCRKNVLKCLYLNGHFAASERELVLSRLVTANITQIIVGPSIIKSLGPDGWLKAGAALQGAKALRFLEIPVYLVFYYDLDFMIRKWKDVLDGIVNLWQTSGRSSLVRLSLNFQYFDSHTTACLLESLKYPVPMELVFSPQDARIFHLADKVKSSFASVHCPVKILTICDAQDMSWKGLFESLRNNTSVIQLKFIRCWELGDEAFKELMDLLQVNLTLQDIDLQQTTWMNNGKAALVKEALERNSMQASYFLVMREAKFSFERAKAGRIFLCGSPFAGKTRLKRTMLETRAKRTIFNEVVKKWKVLLDAELCRTRGIEVDWLEWEDGKKVSIWDLGGQHIFRALQELLFPKISKACAFIFVYSPFVRMGKNRVPKADPVAEFSEDLKQWLRFIVSNSPVTGNILPQVFVTITHKDHIQSPKYNLSFVLDDYVEVVRRLRSRFEGVIDLCLTPTNGIHFVNGKDEANVMPVVDSVLQWMDNLLEQKTPNVPTICSDLILQLAEHSPDVFVSPVRKASSFYQYCCKASASLKEFNPTDEVGRRVLHAVASFMHDAGSIIVVPRESAGKEDLVAVDPNWLTRNFVGELIGQGHGFGSRKGKLCNLPHVLKDGTASIDYLRALLHHILSAKENDGKRLDPEILLELLQGLDLCYKVDGDPPLYFMPLIIGKVERQLEEVDGHPLAWNPESSTTASTHFFGFRMQCHDKERMCLSSVLYPRFQIHLRQTLKQSLGEHHHTFKFARDYLQVEADGHEIIVENDGMEGDHVDFLVRCSSHKSLEMAKQFVRKRFMDEFLSFCASPKGCQGVQLVVAVLRADIVRLLIPHRYRDKTQALPVSELKQKLQNYAEERLQEDGFDVHALFTYEHQWPSIPDYLPSKSELAKNLLQEKDIQDIITVIHKEHLQHCVKLQKLQLISAKLADSPDARGMVVQILQSSPSFKRSTYSVGSSSAASAPKTIEKSENPKSKKSVEVLDEKLASRIEHLELLLEKISRDVDQGFRQLNLGLDEGFKQLGVDLRDFKSILQHTRSMMTTVMSQVDRMFGYTKSMQEHKIPSRPYFTLGDVSIAQQVNAFMQGGKAVRLHFMCESKQGQHPVENQPGVIIQVEKNGTINKCLRKISAISVQMLTLMVEVGVQFTTGVGSVVPEIFNMVTNSAIPVKNLTSVLQDSELDDPKSLEEAWWYLSDYLRDVSHVSLDKYSEEFRLHPVIYKDAEDPFAWLCDRCTITGKQNGLLD
ncbi:hypothetical protein R1sor_005421 [Riccia sorocarpa]|uniref:C-terminal of Roc (COR) domain-containing protein n=1 Tax=Riccia sorocarpa TaxID=122646 RepID=A0ABD3HJH7_9MARC